MLLQQDSELLFSNCFMARHGGSSQISFMIKFNTSMRRLFLIATAISIGFLTLSGIWGSSILQIIAGLGLFVSALGIFIVDRNKENIHLINQIKILTFTILTIVFALIIETVLSASTTIRLFTAIPIALLGSSLMVIYACRHIH